MGTKKYHDKDWLKRKHHKDNLISKEIAQICDVTRDTITKWLSELGIKNRNEEIKWRKNFRSKVENMLAPEYVPLEPYQGALEKIEWRHRDCGNTFQMRPNQIFNGQRCPYCTTDKYKYDTEWFKGKVNEITDAYEVTGEYEHSQTPISMRHIPCGTDFKVKPNSFLFQQCRCPRCSRSSPEQEIENFLKDNDINFESEFTFDDCRDKNPLPFDFAIFNNGELSKLIEYQGEQHFEPVPFWGGKEGLQERQRHDQIKKDYCQENNLDLLTILPSQKHNLPTLLSKKLAELL